MFKGLSPLARILHKGVAAFRNVGRRVKANPVKAGGAKLPV
jgi:hypothetical protein